MADNAAAAAKAKQFAGGDWFRMDKPPTDDVEQRPPSRQFSGPQTKPMSPIPGLYDDKEEVDLPTPRRNLTKEAAQSSYVQLAKQGGHKGLLKMDGEAPTDESPRKTKISEGDTDYVKLAKSGGHADLLKMDPSKVNEETPKKGRIQEDDTEYIKLAKSGGHTDLLKMDGEKNSEDLPKRTQINESDSDYIKLAKSGGHADLLKMECSTLPVGQISNGVTAKYKIKESDTDYIKLAKSGGHADLLKMDAKQKAPSPKKTGKAKVGQTTKNQPSKLGNDTDLISMQSSDNVAQSPRYKVKENDTEFIRLSKQGGHKGLLQMDSNSPARPTSPRYKIKEDDPESVRLAKQGGHKNLLQMDDNASPRPTSPRYTAKEDDTQYVRLAKQGGHKNLLKMDGPAEAPPSVPTKYQVRDEDTEYVKLAKQRGHKGLLEIHENTPQSRKNSGNNNHYSRKMNEHDNENSILPSGPEKEFKSGVRRFPVAADNRMPPFALHY